MTYNMTMKLSGLSDVMVEANSEEEAVAKAKAIVYERDYNEMWAPEAEVFHIYGEKGAVGA